MTMIYDFCDKKKEWKKTTDSLYSLLLLSFFFLLLAYACYLKPISIIEWQGIYFLIKNKVQRIKKKP